MRTIIKVVTHKGRGVNLSAQEDFVFIAKGSQDDNFFKTYRISDMRIALLNIWKNDSLMQNEIEISSC